MLAVKDQTVQAESKGTVVVLGKAGLQGSGQTLEEDKLEHYQLDKNGMQQHGLKES